MNWLLITGVKPYDGRYEFDLEGREFNTREWGWIKRLSGYLPLTIEKGFEGGDPELFTAFAAICLERAGVIAGRDVPAAFERISDAPFGGTIQLESDEPEDAEQGDDAGPPASRLNGNESTSGDGSRTSSETSAGTPSSSGMPDSGSSLWPPAPLAT